MSLYPTLEDMKVDNMIKVSQIFLIYIQNTKKYITDYYYL